MRATRCAHSLERGGACLSCSSAHSSGDGMRVLLGLVVGTSPPFTVTFGNRPRVRPWIAVCPLRAGARVDVDVDDYALSAIRMCAPASPADLCDSS